MENNAEAVRQIFDYGRKSLPLDVRKITASSATQAALIPEGMKIVDLKEFVPETPDRKRVKVSLYDMESFIQYVNEQKTESSRIFGNIASVPYMFTAIIDYHGAAGKEASWMTHNVDFTLKTSPEWKIWESINGKLMPQDAFVEFLKDNAFCVVEPAGATLLEIAMTLEATSGSRCVSKTRTNSGIHIEFKEDVSARAGADGSLTIPDKIKIKIPLFEGQEPLEIEGDFKFRTDSGKMAFGIRLLSLDGIIRESIKSITAAIREKTALPVFLGSVNKED